MRIVILLSTVLALSGRAIASSLTLWLMDYTNITIGADLNDPWGTENQTCKIMDLSHDKPAFVYRGYPACYESYPGFPADHENDTSVIHPLISIRGGAWHAPPIQDEFTKTKYMEGICPQNVTGYTSIGDTSFGCCWDGVPLSYYGVLCISRKDFNAWGQGDNYTMFSVQKPRWWK